MSARVVLLGTEMRIRRISAPKLYDLESADELRERLAEEERERSRRDVED